MMVEWMVDGMVAWWDGLKVARRVAMMDALKVVTLAGERVDEWAVQKENKMVERMVVTMVA